MKIELDVSYNVYMKKNTAISLRKKNCKKKRSKRTLHQSDMKVEYKFQSLK